MRRKMVLFGTKCRLYTPIILVIKQSLNLTVFKAMKRSLLLLVLVFGFFVQSASADDIAPDFSLPHITSEKIHSLKDYRGKVIYLDFWASWCGPCRQSLPALNRFQSEIDSSKFEVIAINLDMDIQDGLDFLAEYPVDYTVLKDDGTGATSRAYNLVGVPTSVLIAKDGTIVSSFQGFHPDHLKKLRKAVEILIE